MPEALKNLAWFLGAITAACGAMIIVIDQYGVALEWKEWIVKAALICGGGLTFLQFSSKDKKVRDETTKTI